MRPSISGLSSLTLSLIFSTFVSPIFAQTPSFTWRFRNRITSLETCEELPITVSTRRGTPPYYMLAFPDGGTFPPTTTFIGDDERDLTYIPTYPPGTNLVLTVIDSNGEYGGGVAFHGVETGTKIDCVTAPSIPTFSFAMSPKPDSNLAECARIDLEITGGTGPYTVTKIATNDITGVNETLSEGHDVFRFVNKAKVGISQLLAVSDSTGKWAVGEQFFTTAIGAIEDCSNANNTSFIKPSASQSALPSSTATPQISTVIAQNTIFVSASVPTSDPTADAASQQAAAAAKEADKAKQEKIIMAVGISVGGIILIGVIAAVVTVVMKRRRLRELEEEEIMNFTGAGPVVIPTTNKYSY